MLIMAMVMMIVMIVVVIAYDNDSDYNRSDCDEHDDNFYVIELIFDISSCFLLLLHRYFDQADLADER